MNRTVLDMRSSRSSASSLPRAALDDSVQDVLKEVAETADVVGELREGCRRKDGAHGRSGRQMPAAEVLHLGAHVQCQTVYRVIEPVQ